MMETPSPKPRVRMATVVKAAKAANTFQEGAANVVKMVIVADNPEELQHKLKNVENEMQSKGLEIRHWNISEDGISADVFVAIPKAILVAKKEKDGASSSLVAVVLAFYHSAKYVRNMAATMVLQASMRRVRARRLYKFAIKFHSTCFQKALPIIDEDIWARLKIDELWAGQTFVSGTCKASPGSIVRVFVENAIVGCVELNRSGHWRLENIPALQPGEAVTATCPELAIGESRPSVRLCYPKIVRATPRTPVPFVFSPIFVGASLISGEGSSNGEEIRIYIDGLRMGGVGKVKNGKWEVDVPPLKVGQMIVATAVDTSRDWRPSKPSEPVCVYEVKTPPPRIFPSHSGQTWVSGDVAGPCNPGTLIRVFIDGVLCGTTRVWEDGESWKLTNISRLMMFGSTSLTSSDMARGTLTATAWDQQAGLGESILAEPVVLNPPPLTSPPQITSDIYQGQSFVQGTCEAAKGSLIFIFADGILRGSSKVEEGGLWSVTSLDSALQCSQSVTAKCRDTVLGLQMSMASRPVLVTPPPVSPVPFVDPIVAGSTVITGTTSASPGSCIRVYVDGFQCAATIVQEDGGWKVEALHPRKYGEKVTAKAQCPGCQLSCSSEVVVVSYASITAVPYIHPGVAEGGTVITGKCHAAKNSVIRVFANGKIIGAALLDDVGNWMISGMEHRLIGGDFLTATAQDQEQSMAESSPCEPVRIQNALTTATPEISEDIIAGDDAISGKCTASPGSVVQIRIDRRRAACASVSSDGSWSVSGLPPLQQGSIISAVAKDYAKGLKESPCSLPAVVEGPQVTHKPTINGPLTSQTTTVSGKCEANPGSFIRLFVNEILVGTTALSSYGDWSISGVMLPGAAIVTATAQDVTGGLMQSRHSRATNVAPTEPLLPPTITKCRVLAGVTLISGVCNASAGTVISIMANGERIGSTQVTINGSWALTHHVSISIGVVLIAQAHDRSQTFAASQYSNQWLVAAASTEESACETDEQREQSSTDHLSVVLKHKVIPDKNQARLLTSPTPNEAETEDVLGHNFQKKKRSAISIIRKKSQLPLSA